MAIKIDYVSDIACPWCAVGLGGLEIALKNIGETITVEIHFQPFELNPQMPPGGQEVFEHLMQKYGKTEAQVRATQQDIKARAATVGYPFIPKVVSTSTTPSMRIAYFTGQVSNTVPPRSIVSNANS